MEFKTYTKSKGSYPTFRHVVKSILLSGILCLLALNLSAAVPANDDCSGAITITCGQSLSGSTLEATSTDNPGTCGTSLSTAPGVWYHFLGTGEFIKATTCGAGTNYDTKLGVFSGSCGSLSCVDGDDDDPNCSLKSTVLFTSTSGVDYYIYVSGFGTNKGDFDLSLSCIPPAANDDICNAQALTLGVSTPFSNIGASVQPGEPSPGSGSDGSSCDSNDGWCSFETDVQTSVWFTFIPTTECISIGAISVDYQLAIWQGNCGDFNSLVEIAANDDGGPGLSPYLDAVPVIPGQVYYVQVDGFSGAQAEGTILVEPSNGCPIICDKNNLTLTLNLDNFPGEVTWELRTDGGALVNEGGPYTTAGATVVESLCSDPGCYVFTIFDSFGDGICCGFGNGSYTLTNAAGTVIASGSDYGDSDATPFCIACQNTLGPPWTSSDVGAANGDAFYDDCEDLFGVSSVGFNTPTSDVQHLGAQSICGNTEIIAKVESITNPGFTGIEIRESLAPGSKKVALKTQLSSFVFRDVRAATNAPASSQQFIKPGHSWLRLVRTGNTFIGYSSTNGIAWQQTMVANVSMSSCAYVGLFTEGINSTITTTGYFSNVSIGGVAQLVTPEVPTIEAQSLVPEKVQQEQPGLYPNPATSALNVKFGTLTGKSVIVRIYNELGQEVWSREFENAGSVESIPVNSLPGGMYYMHLTAAEASAPTTLKFQVLNNRP